MTNLWILYSTEPKTMGMYERQYENGTIGFSYWNGEYFSQQHATIERAYKYRKTQTTWPCRNWRELSEEWMKKEYFDLSLKEIRSLAYTMYQGPYFPPMIDYKGTKS